jgi:hypothetical protein
MKYYRRIVANFSIRGGLCDNWTYRRSRFATSVAICEIPSTFAKYWYLLIQSDLSDLSNEKEALAFCTTAAYHATDDHDLGTRQLFKKIAIDEEGQMSWLELQLDLLEKIGEPAYIAKFMSAE